VILSIGSSSSASASEADASAARTPFQQHQQQQQQQQHRTAAAAAGGASDLEDSCSTASSAVSYLHQYRIDPKEEASRVHVYIDDIRDICMQSDKDALEDICAAHGALFAYRVAKLAVRMHAFAADESIYLAYRRVCREHNILEARWDDDKALDARAAAVNARVAAEDARTAFLVAFSDTVPRFGGGAYADHWYRVKREAPHKFYMRRGQAHAEYMQRTQRHLDRLQPQMREALVAADAEYDSFTAQQVRLTQQLAALQTQSSISKAQLSGAKRELAHLLALSGRAPSSHVDSAMKEQRNKITELKTKLAQDDTEQADALNAELARLTQRMLHLRLRRASLMEYTLQKAG